MTIVIPPDIWFVVCSLLQEEYQLYCDWVHLPTTRMERPQPPSDTADKAYDALKAVSLTCKTLLPVARDYLIFNMSFNRFQEERLTFYSAPHVARHVRNVYVAIADHEAVAKILRRVEFSSGLSIVELRNFVISYTSLQALSNVTVPIPTLKITSRGFKLRLENPWQAFKILVSNLECHISVTNLELSTYDAAEIGLLAFCLKPGHLRSITLRIDDRPSFSALANVLEEHPHQSSHLTRLSITYGGAARPDPIHWNRVINVCASLPHLRVGEPWGIDHGPHPDAWKDPTVAFIRRPFITLMCPAVMIPSFSDQPTVGALRVTRSPGSKRAVWLLSNSQTLFRSLTQLSIEINHSELTPKLLSTIVEVCPELEFLSLDPRFSDYLVG